MTARVITSGLAVVLYSYLRSGVHQPLADLIFIAALILSNIPSGERLPSTDAGVLINMTAGFILALLLALVSNMYGGLVVGFLEEMGVRVSIDLSFLLPLAYTVSLPLALAMISLLRKLPLYTACLVILLKDDDKWRVLTGGSKEKYLQFSRLRTFRAILEGSERERWSKSTNLVIQMYFKAYPLADRVPWALMEPADGGRGTVYVGFDVSRRFMPAGPLETLRERVEVAVRAAICDPRGTVVRMKTIKGARGEVLGYHLTKGLLENVVDESKAVLGSEPKRLVLMKDGRVGRAERELVKEGIGEFSSSTGIQVELYSVEKRIVERIYKGVGSPTPGTYVKLSDGSLLLVSSLPPGGHPQPLRITRILAAPEGSGPRIEEFAREFFHLSHLHWQSMFSKIKTALPLKVVQEIGEFATKGVDIPGVVGYLPL